MDQLLPFIGDMGFNDCDPVQDGEDGKVSLEARGHLGAVEHGLGIFPVGHLLLREGGTEDILKSLFQITEGSPVVHSHENSHGGYPPAK